jgi:hypothetical protein
VPNVRQRTIYVDRQEFGESNEIFKILHRNSPGNTNKRKAGRYSKWN